MARIENTVFISYRRADVYTALAVYQDLTAKGYDVFFDYTSIPSGDFEQIIISNIRARAHFVLILTPAALDRCSEPGDWLRREIETAIDEKRNIVPLFFKGFSFGAPAVSQQLTGKLGNINRYNGLNVHEDYFHAAMDRLSTQFLNIPFTTVLHPVSTEVQKVVHQEQVAVNEALAQQWEEIKELFKPAKEKTGKTHSSLGKDKSFQPRLVGIGAGILLIATLGVFGIRSMIQNSDGKETPTATLQTGLISTPTITDVAPTQTQLVLTSTEMPILPTLTFTSTPTLGIGSTIISPKDDMTLLYVPAGKFQMGSDQGDTDELPYHDVFLDAFWIDQTEVTNAMYGMCDSVGACEPPASASSVARDRYYGMAEYEMYPVVFVSWEAAKAYCEWAGRRLPTEAEWEKAATGADGRFYPWGNAVPDNELLNFNTVIGDTTAVATYPDGASPYFALDMAGNVWEWVADWYGAKYYENTRSSNPFGPISGQYRVMRGGSWSNKKATEVRSANRLSNGPSTVLSNIGFRCARSE